MATTRGWALHGNIMNAIEYVLDLKNEQQKTEDGILVDTSEGTGTPLLDGVRWKEQHINHKNKGVGYHLQFSLPPGEGTPEDCLELAKEWIDTISKGKAKYVIAVHTNKGSIHAHVICDWYLNDGKRWNIYFKQDRYRFRAAADRICKAHGFSVLENTQEKGQHYFDWMQNRTDSDRMALTKILEDTVDRVASYEDFKNYLEACGFTVMDDRTEKKKNENVFTFTADIKLIHPESNGTFKIRIPYQKDWIEVNSENIKWLKENKTAQITIPIDKEIHVFNENLVYRETVLTDRLKKHFEEKSKKERKGLRIIMPHGKKVIRTKFLKDEHGHSYSLESIEQRIAKNGRYFSDPKIQDVIRNAGSYQSVLDAQQDLYERADVKSEMDSTTIFRSKKQENYFRWRAQQIQRRMDKLSYENLLEKDRKDLPLMQSRKQELIEQLDEVQAALKEMDQELNQILQQRIEGTLQISDEELEKAIEEGKAPLLEKKNTLKESIRLYSDRIQKAEAYQKKKYRQQEQTR